MERWEILNDGPDRWVVIDNESDDPCPVFSIVDAAERYKAEQISSLENV